MCVRRACGHTTAYGTSRELVRTTDPGYAGCTKNGLTWFVDAKTTTTIIPQPTTTRTTTTTTALTSQTIVDYYVPGIHRYLAPGTRYLID